MQTTNKLNFTLPNDTEIVFTRDFDAPRDLVFECLTSCEHLPKWMYGWEGWSMPICEMDLRTGGTFRWGWQKDDGDEKMEITGDIREYSPPERLVNTERWGGDWPEAVNTMVLTESGGKTSMTLTCSYPSKEARDNAIKTGMSDGMSVSYDRLDLFLASQA